MDTKLTGAELIYRLLKEHHTDTVFGYPGSCVMLLLDSFYKEKKIDHILVRHEQGAVHAATGYSVFSGKPGIVLVTSGPAATNTISGIADAAEKAVPLIVITGQVTSDLLGTDAFQEVDMIGISGSVSKWNAQIRSADQIEQTINKAFHIALSGRPGPVVLDITKDAQSGLVTQIRDKRNVADIKLPQRYFTIGSIPGSTGRNDLLDIVIKELKEADPALIPIIDIVSGDQHPIDYPYIFGMADKNEHSGNGYGLSAALGAKCAMPRKTVCLIAGYSEFQTASKELGVLKQSEIDIKMILIPDEQKDARYPVKHPDFIRLINAYGFQGRTASNRQTLSTEVRAILKTDESCLLVCTQDILTIT